MITALKLLNEAKKLGWTFVVDQGDEDDGAIETASPTKAWELVKEVDEAWVAFHDAAANRLGAAHLMAPGVNTCSPEESLVNYSSAGKGAAPSEFEALCDRMIEEAE